ncbi:hypothetical protein B0H17DRAFT_1093157 [Neofusicoccum parvum]|nr:hypothetical protein B0H17DRAFT_1093157 [Neofusicoccum parvum]
MRIRVVLSLTTAATALTASAQSTTYYTSTSWALLDNTDLFPKQTPTASTTPTTALSDATASVTPTATAGSFSITPPIPCPGLYYTYGGVCCTSNTLLDCDYSDVYSGTQNASSCCPVGEFGWALPLSARQIADAQADGTYSGCPGNSRNGVCCSGGVIYQDDGAEVCSLGSVVWVATTAADGRASTSTLPPESASATSEPAWYSSMTAAGRESATATVTGAARGVGSAWCAVDGRAWVAVALALGAVL